MGFILSKIGWSSEPVGYDIPDDKTGLTPREKDIVRNSWDLVKKNVKGNGVDLFVSFFTKYPEHQKLFRSFANVPLDQLKNNSRLLGHATSVIYSFTSLVDNLDDVDCLSELLIKIADSHLPRKVYDKQFQDLTEVIILFLTEKLGTNIMNDDGKKAWIKVMNVVNSTLKAEQEKMMKKTVEA